MCAGYKIEMKDNLLKLLIENEIVFICATDSIKYLTVIPEINI